VKAGNQLAGTMDHYAKIVLACVTRKVWHFTERSSYFYIFNILIKNDKVKTVIFKEIKHAWTN